MLNRRLFIALFCIIILQFSWASVAIAAPVVDASSAVLIDGQTGKVLWSKNADQIRPIASTTKIMTGLLAIEKVSPEEVVTADNLTEKTAESEIYLEKNEKMTVNDLIYALMLQSANDAAVALAKHISGSVPDFAELMNAKAKTLGLKNSRFVNPHGLYDANKSTANDMAQLGRHAIKNRVFASIVRTKKVSIKGKTKRTIFNRNKLLWRYPYAVGIKTGYTKPAGFCLVSAAKKGKMLLVAATLNSKTQDSSFSNAKNIFEYGFRRLKYVPVSKKGQVLKKIDVPFTFNKMAIGTDEDFGVTADKNSQINTKIFSSQEVNLPIHKGDRLGQIRVYDGSKLIASKALKAQKSAPEIGVFGKLAYWFKSFFRQVV